MENMNEFWSLNEGTFYCLYDDLRTEAFKKAIDNTVQKGDVVVEIGAGSGILSMFAADAGAKKVYAVELDNMNARTLKRSVLTNDYADRIEVIEADGTAVDMPEKADVVICEMIATGLIEELQVPAMNNALKFMKEDAKVLLKQYDITTSLVKDNNVYYGKTFEIARFAFPDIEELTPTVMSNEHTLRQVDFTTATTETKINDTFKLTIEADGSINGLKIGGHTTFWDGSTFDASLSYSFPIILPIPTQSVKTGDSFTVRLSYTMCEGPRNLEYEVTKD